MHKLHAVVMAGGSGTRFWPASRKRRPKQVLPLVHGQSLIAATIDRVASLIGIERTWIVTGQPLAATLASELPALPSHQIIVEPAARDTAPCAALATAWVDARDPGAVVALMPADHVITPQHAFHRLLLRASELAATRPALITLGIPPARASSAYGYVERGARLDELEPAAFRVASFREKPDPDTATRYFASGRYAWNSGIFLWTFDTLLAAMEAQDPELAACTRAMRDAIVSSDQTALEAAFARAPRTSIDYAVMENAPEVLTVQADLDWTDLGSFVTLDAVNPTDANRNVTALLDGARAVLHEAEGCVTYAEGPRTIALFGVRDLVVVAVDDAVLVCPRDRADDLKALLDRVREQGLEDIL